MTSADKPLGNLAFFGGILILAGLGLALYAFQFDVGVVVPASEYVQSSRVANADRVAVRTMILLSGVGCFVSGWVAFGASVIARSVDHLSSRQDPAPPG